MKAMKAKSYSMLDGLRARLREFRCANGANVATTFALATVPIIGFVGAAVDYSHANSVKAAMQAAADSTALMLSKDAANLTSSQIQTKGNDYFKALFTRPEATGLTVDIIYSTTDGSKVTVNATANVKTDFMQLMGFSNLKVGANAEARWGTMGKMHIGLALDNTGSMAWDGKMPALKTAAKEFLTILQNSAKNKPDIRVAIVPFAKYVNVGSSNYNQSWIDWEEWDDNNGSDKTTTTCTNQKTGKSGKKTKKCSTTTTWVPDDHKTWNGCVTDRDQNYDVLNASPKPGDPATQFPAAPENTDCPVPVMELSFDYTALKNKIDSMYPDGYTNQGIGLAWAWMALTQGQPMNAPAQGADIQRIIVLMSDGQNTANRWYDDQASIDARQAIACKNIKAAGITIYTVLVMAGNSQVLKECASKPEYYFEVTSANQTIAVFKNIGTNLSNLRIAK